MPNLQNALLDCTAPFYLMHTIPCKLISHLTVLRSYIVTPTSAYNLHLQKCAWKLQIAYQRHFKLYSPSQNPPWKPEGHSQDIIFPFCLHSPPFLHGEFAGLHGSSGTRNIYNNLDLPTELFILYMREIFYWLKCEG